MTKWRFVFYKAPTMDALRHVDYIAPSLLNALSFFLRDHPKAEIFQVTNMGVVS